MPSVIAEAQTEITQNGTTNSSRKPPSTRTRQIQAVEAYVSTSSVNNSEGFFQL
jgi:hypothetical protein